MHVMAIPKRSCGFEPWWSDNFKSSWILQRCQELEAKTTIAPMMFYLRVAHLPIVLNVRLARDYKRKALADAATRYSTRNVETISSPTYWRPTRAEATEQVSPASDHT